MYSVWTTFFGVALSQKEVKSPFVALQRLAQDGWNLESLTPELLETYLGEEIQDEVSWTKEDVEMLKWVFAHAKSLSNLEVSLDMSYSGSGDCPVFFGIPMDLSHPARYHAVKATATTRASEKAQVNALYEFVRTHPFPQGEELLEELDFYALAGTS